MIDSLLEWKALSKMFLPQIHFVHRNIGSNYSRSTVQSDFHLTGSEYASKSASQLSSGSA